jgi:hypothetical protein
VAYLNTARHPQVLHPSAEKLNSPGSRQDRKKGALVNTPTLTWVYTRTFKERVRRARNSTTGIGSFFNPNGMLFI